MGYKKYIDFLNNKRKNQCDYINKNNSKCEYCELYLKNKYPFSYSRSNYKTDNCCIDAIIDLVNGDEKQYRECGYYDYYYKSKFDNILNRILCRYIFTFYIFNNRSVLPTFNSI